MSKRLTAKNLLREVRTLKKLASQDPKDKLIALLKSEDIGSINQALSFNESLDLLTKKEIGDILIPFVISETDKGKYDVFWEEYGLGWLLLETAPNHPYWANLTTLMLNGNNLTSLPKEIGNLKNLRYLESERNNLTSIPKEIGNLKNLRVLSLHFNKLTSIPKEIGNLKSLRSVFLDNNNLTSIPKEIEDMRERGVHVVI